jgi:hypothetical protein
LKNHCAANSSPSPLSWLRVTYAMTLRSIHLLRNPLHSLLMN